METQYKNNANGGTESGMTNHRREDEVMVANKRKVRGWDFLLRLLALALSLAAAVVLGVNKETTTVSKVLVPTLPPINVSVTAKWHYLSAFVYLVVANAIAGGYAAVTLLVTLANRGGKKRVVSMLVMILDLVMVAILFSAIGAALAVGILGHKGNSHVHWDKVCYMFDRFCHQVGAALGLSGAAAAAFLMILVLAIFNLHKKH